MSNFGSSFINYSEKNTFMYEREREKKRERERKNERERKRVKVKKRFKNTK
jgi:hypothetical protein